MLLKHAIQIFPKIASTNAAPSFGPVIAGALTQNLGWRWIFWFLSIFTGTYLLVVLLLLPETQRKVVGNGSIPVKGIYRSFFEVFIQDCKVAKSSTQTQASTTGCHIPNPFKCIKLLFRKANFTIITIGSITYAVKMTLQTSLAVQCIQIYKLNYLQAGLVYLPSGIGGAIASYITGW